MAEIFLEPIQGEDKVLVKNGLKPPAILESEQMIAEMLLEFFGGYFPNAMTIVLPTEQGLKRINLTNGIMNVRLAKGELGIDEKPPGISYSEDIKSFQSFLLVAVGVIDQKMLLPLMSSSNSEDLPDMGLPELIGTSS